MHEGRKKVGATSMIWCVPHYKNSLQHIATKFQEVRVPAAARILKKGVLKVRATLTALHLSFLAFSCQVKTFQLSRIASSTGIVDAVNGWMVHS